MGTYEHTHAHTYKCFCVCIHRTVHINGQQHTAINIPTCPCPQVGIIELLVELLARSDLTEDVARPCCRCLAGLAAWHDLRERLEAAGVVDALAVYVSSSDARCVWGPGVTP